MQLNRRWILPLCLYFIVLLTIIGLAYGGILPVKVTAIPFYDTIGHFILLGTASYLAHKMLGNQIIQIFNRSLALPVGPIGVSLFAMVDESLQALSPMRTCSWSDMIANLIGIWFFYWLAKLK